MQAATRGEARGGVLRSGAAWALYATALTPLVFSSRTIYPYVLPRAVYFRVLVAGAAAVALYLLAARGTAFSSRAADRSSRAAGRSGEAVGAVGASGEPAGPPARRARDPFLLALGAFVLVLLGTALLGAAPLRSLFGDMERMGGVIAWVHFLAFYVALRTLLGERELMAFLWVTAVAATVVSAIAILQARGVTVGILPGAGAARVFGTLGNPGYLAIYALFGAAVAALLGLRSGRWAGRVPAAAAFAANAAALTLTWTRAALLGLAAGLLLGPVGYAAMAESRRRRGWSLAALAGLLLVAGVAGSDLWSGAAERFRGAERLADVSLLERNLGLRYAAWKAGARAAADDPLTGLGAENFRLAFDWHLDPARFNPVHVHYTRAHNDLVEFLVAGGVPGALAWVALWAALFWVVAAARREGKLGAGETALLGGAFAAYLVYLLFWFHDQNSLPVFLALAAYAATRRDGPLPGPGVPETDPDRETGRGRPRVAARPARLAIALALALGAVADLAYHGRLLAAGHHLLEGAESRRLDEKVAHYERALELRPAGGEEAVTELVRFATQLSGALGRADRGSEAGERVEGVLERSRRALAAQIERDPRNPRLHRDAGRLYVMSYQWGRNPAHLDSAAARLGEAIALAPGRLNYRHMLSEAHLMAERPADAVRALEEGLARYEAYGETHYFLAKALLVGGSLEEAAEALLRAYELGYRDRNPAVRQVLFRELRARGEEETVARLREARRGPR